MDAKIVGQRINNHEMDAKVIGHRFNNREMDAKVVGHRFNNRETDAKIIGNNLTTVKWTPRLLDKKSDVSDCLPMLLAYIRRRPEG